jgi:hypothetical protein
MRLPLVLTLAISAACAGAVAVAPAANASVHFATPLAATRYFAAASNSGNLTALHRVTTPDSFHLVMGMRKEARDVRAQSCSATGQGDYNCVLSYKFAHKQGTGDWNIIVAPAIAPGWYVYTYISCGG